MKLVILAAALATALLVSADVAPAREQADDAVEAAIRAEFAYRPAHARRAQRSALSTSEREELRRWLSEAAGKGLVPVRQTDPRELRMLDLVQKAARRAPASKLLSVLGGPRAMRARLEKCAEFLKEHEANGLFMDVGSVNGNQLTAATLQATFISGKPKDVRNFGTVLVVLDSNNNEVTDGSGLSNKGQTTLLTDAPPGQGTINEEKPPVATAIFTTFMTDGTPCRQRSVAQVLPPPKSIEVTAPNNPQSRATVICLNRGRPEPGWTQPCDFGPFPQAQIQPGGIVSVVVPLAGTIMMPYPLALKNGKVDGQLQVTAINSQNGTTCSGQDNDLGSQVLAATTPTADNQGITWSILADKALIFGQSCYQPHSGLAFNMYWTVKVTKPGGKPATVTAIVSNVLQQGSANTLIVNNVDLQWGCVPAGTLVTLMDGSRKAIEAMTREDLVLGADGRPWQVFNLLAGDDAELIVVTAEDGTVARMTPEHPVIIGEDDRARPRWVTASKLAAGMPLVTVKGESKAAAVERRAYGGTVYNMVLRPQGSNHTPAQGGGFYADGLLVGDQTMQGLPQPAPAIGRTLVPTN